MYVNSLFSDDACKRPMFYGDKPCCWLLQEI